jgi:hypothetical protein
LVNMALLCFVARCGRAVSVSEDPQREYKDGRKSEEEKRQKKR